MRNKVSGDPYKGCTKPEPDPECQANSCGENADCVIRDGKVNCFCKNGYQGDPSKKCDKIPEACKKCGANTDCYTLLGQAVCTCRSGYSGDPYKGCDKPEQCLPDSCGENASCFIFSGKPTCFCNLGYIGDPKKGCTPLIGR